MLTEEAEIMAAHISSAWVLDSLKEPYDVLPSENEAAWRTAFALHTVLLKLFTMHPGVVAALKEDGVR